MIEDDTGLTFSPLWQASQKDVFSTAQEPALLRALRVQPFLRQEGHRLEKRCWAMPTYPSIV